MPTSDGTGTPAGADVDGRVVGETRARMAADAADVCVSLNRAAPRWTAAGLATAGRRGRGCASIHVTSAFTVGRELRSRHPAHEHVVINWVKLGSSPLQWNGSVPRSPVCNDCVRRGAGRVAAGVAVEGPHPAVVVAFDVAGGAGDEAARVGVEEEMAGVGPALGRQGDVGAVRQREHRGLARLSDDAAVARKRDRDRLPDDLRVGRATGHRRRRGPLLVSNSVVLGARQGPRVPSGLQPIVSSTTVARSVTRQPRELRCPRRRQWSTYWSRCRSTRTQPDGRPARWPCRRPAPGRPGPGRSSPCRRARRR